MHHAAYSSVFPSRYQEIIRACLHYERYWFIDRTTDNPYLMTDNLFEWDDGKAADNLRKHGVSFELAKFELAKKVFKDPLGVERIDDRQDYGEERFVLIGLADGNVLFVAYTERDGRFRLISARRATRDEQEDYFSQNT